jgi:hypothetical protein
MGLWARELIQTGTGGSRYASSGLDEGNCPLIDGGLVRVPLLDVLPLEDAARAHEMIDTGHVRGKRVLKVAELSA